MSERLVVEEMLQLPIKLLSARDLEPGKRWRLAWKHGPSFELCVVELEDHHGRLQLEGGDVARLSLNKHGYRWYIHCPDCDRRCDQLLSPRGTARWRCRQCHGALYRAQYLSNFDRWRLRGDPSTGKASAAPNRKPARVELLAS